MLRRYLAAALLVGALAVPAAAEEESRYSEWRQDGAGTAGPSALEELARELEALIDEADRARAADPRFLQDLRDAIAAHVADARPTAPLIRDDFSDGDYTDDPRWTVVSGDFAIDRRFGLRTIVPVAGAEASLADAPLDAILDAGGELLDSGKETIDDLLSGETKLDDLLGGDEEEMKEDTGPAGPEPAEIVLNGAIPNAFTLEVEMTSRLAGKNAHVDIDLFRRAPDYAGYRLSYLPGGDSALTLARFGRRGVVVIGEHDDRLALEDGQSHTLTLARADDGTMTAGIDGAPLIEVRSTAFTEPFDGLALVNGGGDYGIRNIAVHDGR